MYVFVEDSKLMAESNGVTTEIADALTSRARTILEIMRSHGVDDIDLAVAISEQVKTMIRSAVDDALSGEDPDYVKDKHRILNQEEFDRLYPKDSEED